jgi:hypothetical protein
MPEHHCRDLFFSLTLDTKNTVIHARKFVPYLDSLWLFERKKALMKPVK